MMFGVLFRFIWCGLLVSDPEPIDRDMPDIPSGPDRVFVKIHISARYVGNNAKSDIDAVTAEGQPDADNNTSTHVMLEKSSTPDCELLKHRVDEDPRWNFETASLASCECGHSWALLKCKVVIPNDHIFDERNIGKDRDLCGRSVYDAVPRWWSAKSRPRCVLDKDNIAHLTWNNGIGTNIKWIKQGFDEGTCGYFKDVQCIKE